MPVSPSFIVWSNNPRNLCHCVLGSVCSIWRSFLNIWYNSKVRNITLGFMNTLSFFIIENGKKLNVMCVSCLKIIQSTWIIFNRDIKCDMYGESMWAGHPHEETDTVTHCINPTLHSVCNNASFTHENNAFNFSYLLYLKKNNSFKGNKNFLHFSMPAQQSWKVKTIKWSYFLSSHFSVSSEEACAQPFVVISSLQFLPI